MSSVQLTKPSVNSYGLRLYLSLLALYIDKLAPGWPRVRAQHVTDIGVYVHGVFLCQIV